MSETATKAFVTAEIEALRQETKAEFAVVHKAIGRLETDVEELKADVRELKTDVRELKTEFGELKADFGEMRVTMRQMEIRARNSRLKNPIARIRPVPIFVQGRGAEEPNPDYFPKYADQLYGLRTPQKERDYQMLAYLSKFYDIQLEAADTSQSSEEIQVDPERAVELLEEILGLDEDNFIAFRARAQQFATQGPTAEKRDRPATSSSGGPQPHRRRLQTPSDGAPTIPFTITPSRARGHPAPADQVGSPTIPFTKTPSRALEPPSDFHTVAARPRHPSTIPDTEETASS
ncbi:hypothetical protein MFIFM68171_02236 [Madurella fahalii]|uniref:Uncharacterized protein n=1 Tax=Madurella fahalii TaxID=1157608 RepID=A0ABQ0G2Q9_9PEZI